MTLAPDRLAFDRAMVTQPVWNRFDTAADALGLAGNVLLHAGPAFASVDLVPAPVMNSACVAAVYEGLAPDFDRAEAMIRAGEIVLRPAQGHGIVTPLAAVVSASMPLHSVYDAWRGQARVLAPVNGGDGPGLRLGLRSQAVLDHLRWLNTRFVDVLRGGLAEGIALVPLAAAGLREGDDCHGRTAGATAGLVRELEERSLAGISDERSAAFMARSPSLFLNLWMAATKLMMTCAEGGAGSSLVTAAGGNGHEVGIQISGLPGRWFTAPATPPRGRLDADLPADRALGAIGDSALVDAFGLGGMAIRFSPGQQTALGAFLPIDGADRSVLTIGRHPYFKGLDLRLGVSARAVAELGKGPLVVLGILDRSGVAGRLGAGVYDIPAAPFAAAVDALDTEAGRGGVLSG